MTWLWITLGVLVGLVLLVYVIGLMVEREHVATVSRTYKATPEEVWNTITGFEEMPSWRKGLKRVEILEPLAGKKRVREHGGFGPMTFLIEEEDPPHKLVLRIADDDQGFGGTWTYEIRRVAAGAELRITENGWIDSPLFRFMAKFVFGYDGTIRGYHASLGQKLSG